MMGHAMTDTDQTSASESDQDTPELVFDRHRHAELWQRRIEARRRHGFLAPTDAQLDELRALARRYVNPRSD
jgi:hypothetical protein